MNTEAKRKFLEKLGELMSDYGMEICLETSYTDSHPESFTIEHMRTGEVLVEAYVDTRGGTLSYDDIKLAYDKLEEE